MQAEGFNLEAIRRLLSGSELQRVATMPGEAPVTLTAEELASRFGDDPAALAEAERLGVLVPLGDGRFEAPSPALLRAAEEAVERGVGLAASLRVVAEVQAGCAAMARAFVGVFAQELMRPSLEEAEAVAAVEGLRPVAAQTVLAVLDLAMAADADRSAGPRRSSVARRPSRARTTPARRAATPSRRTPAGPWPMRSGASANSSTGSCRFRRHGAGRHEAVVLGVLLLFWLSTKWFAGSFFW